MTRYFVELNADGSIFGIGVGLNGSEITEAEYNALLNMIRAKDKMVNDLYAGEITINDVPAEWREEIQRRVDERIAAEGEAENQDISADEALDIILGGENA